jgi:putative acetyltransferase
MKEICINVRFEEPGDEERIRKVHLQAFEGEPEANLVDSLRNSGIELISLVAEANGDVVGHILFSPVTIDGDIRLMGLAPMAVLPAWQRKGIGAKLINEGLEACKRTGYEAVVLLGHPDYYSRFGFVCSQKFGVESEYDVPQEAFMVIELKKGALKGIKGTVKYHEVFNSLLL